MRRNLIAPLFALALLACGRQPKIDAAPPAAPTPSYAAEGLAARSLPEVAAALAAGETSSADLVAVYLARIAQLDRAGPRLQSVIAINPDAATAARAADARRAAGAALGPLDGVPVLVKDNVETRDRMPTTAGSLALLENFAEQDSPAVAALRAQGAIILGKTNLSEWANYRSDLSISGWSAVGGQTRNPHMLDRSPCGSSSGSGAAVAAGLAPAAIGTETSGSIICPASVNGIVGLKPTIGVLPQTGIVPISASQDTAGPMATTVAGAALLMDAMTGTDAYSKALRPDALAGVKVAALRFAVGSNPDIIALFDAALETLKAAGADIVEIAEFAGASDGPWPEIETVLDHEFKAGLEAYLAGTPPAVRIRTLDDLIAFNRENAGRELALFGQDIFEKAAKTEGLEAPAYRAALAKIQRWAREDGIDKLIADSGAEILVAPSGPLASRIDPVNGDVWPDWAGAGVLAAVAGYPHLTVPMGAVDGLPAGLSFIGGRGADAAMLAAGHAYELRAQARVEPKYLADAEARPEIAAAMAAR